jgi:hypothetical protein
MVVVDERLEICEQENWLPLRRPCVQHPLVKFAGTILEDRCQLVLSVVLARSQAGGEDSRELGDRISVRELIRLQSAVRNGAGRLGCGSRNDTTGGVVSHRPVRSVAVDY